MNERPVQYGLIAACKAPKGSVLDRELPKSRPDEKTTSAILSRQQLVGLPADSPSDTLGSSGRGYNCRPPPAHGVVIFIMVLT